MNTIYLKIFSIFIYVFICKYCTATEFISESVFNNIVSKNVFCHSLTWINPENISTIIPHDYTWIREGSAGYGSYGYRAPGIATTGVNMCTGLTAFTMEGYPALAHITDMTSPDSAVIFLKKIRVDLKKPITLISKTLNDDHLLPIKWALENKFNEPIIHIKTLPIFKYKRRTITCFSNATFQSVNLDIRGISFSFEPSGLHSFFYMESRLQEKMTKFLDRYNPINSSFETLYVHRLND